MSNKSNKKNSSDKSADKAKETETKKTKDNEKKSEEDGDKKAKLDKMTTSAGLSFSVNRFKEWMLEQFRTAGIKDEDKPKISGSHVALAAANEALCNYILKATVTSASKEKTGLYNLSKASIGYVVQQDEDLLDMFYRDVYGKRFDPKTNYANQYCIDQSVMNKYIEAHFSKNLKFDQTAYNFLVYVLNRFSVQVNNTAFEMMTYANKNTLTESAIKTAVRIHCPENVAKLLCVSIESAIKASGIEDKRAARKKGDDDKDKKEGDDKEKDKKDAKKDDDKAKENDDKDNDEKDEPKKDEPKKDKKNKKAQSST